MTINVMLVDDHKMLREGIKQLLEFDPEIKVVSSAQTGKECLSLLEENKPDVVLLDINLPDTTGIKLIKDIKKRSKTIKVMMLTVHNEVEYLVDSLDGGADGYILKDSGADELIKAIKFIYNGERYIEPSLIPSLNARLVQLETETDMVKSLTKREIQILSLLVSGKSNLDISEILKLSEQTIKNHVTALYKKIGVKDRTQAAVFAIRNNIVSM
ncbi:MAG: response regulator transcription factor [Lachnospiraceae bacterium]|nr:response regulator transcription factor [Lachnospiraceae bacterium]